MILPLNGRVVIIDDKIQEAQPLISILSKNRIPFNYYTGTNAAEFPDNPDDNKLRVLFLDLNIFELNKDAKTVISSIHGILNSIIPNNPNPYLLVVWSKQNADYLDELKHHFDKHLNHKKPAKIIFLSKSQYFSYTSEKGWEPQPGALQLIQEELSNQLEEVSLLKNLVAWENIVHLNASDTINEFCSFHEFDKDWDKNSKSTIYWLAKSIIGTDDIIDSSDDLKLSKAFLNFNSFLSDKNEQKVEHAGLGKIVGIPTKDEEANISPNVASKINSTLHISEKEFNISYFNQGNIYQIDDEDDLVTRIAWDKLFHPVNPAKVAEIRESSILIQLDITPVCDYSQDKKYMRIIHGLIINPEHKKYFKSDFYYTTCPTILIDSKEKCLIFDFRQIKTVDKNYIIARNINPKLQLRRELCTDIQSQLANQVNRPGINSVQLPLKK